MKKYTFKVTVKVSQQWVDDGMDLESTKKRIERKICDGNLNGWATSDEVDVTVEPLK